MMKEHIIDSYGLVKYTLGTGCSGGSINSNMNLSIMPGVLDGVITTCTYPDSETTSLEVGDCSLLVEAYQKPALLNLWTSMSLTQADVNLRKGAINGHLDQTACQAWFNLFGSNGKAGLFTFRAVSPTRPPVRSPTWARPTTANCRIPPCTTRRTRWPPPTCRAAMPGPGPSRSGARCLAVRWRATRATTWACSTA